MQQVTFQTGLCFILLTYKGKVLLLQQEDVLNIPNNNAWHFIFAPIRRKEVKIKTKILSPEKTIIQEVEKETKLKLDEVTLLSTISTEDAVQYLFHTKLSDKHVNSINRAEGRILQFFGVNELASLQIQPSTKSFFKNNKAFMESLSVS